MSSLSLIPTLYRFFEQSYAVTTDTRTLKAGDLFFALKGERFNGNEFVPQALEKGASLCIVDEMPAGIQHDRVWLVDDALVALQKLARFHRQKLNVPVLAITGSNGKTTTKELITRVLENRFEVYATPGNFNNHIGLPLTLLGAKKETEMIVVELGDNHPGEIAALCEIALPDYGLITNIGKDHIEGFGSFEANVQAKNELFQFLKKSDGHAFISANDPILVDLGQQLTSPIWYGKQGEEEISLVDAEPYLQYETRTGEKVQTQLIGEFNFTNFQAAYVVGKYFEVEEQKIHEALKGYVPQNNRSQLILTAHNKLFLDAYNANPSSVEAALESFSKISHEGDKVVILGDMLELGLISSEEHRNIVDLTVSLSFDAVYFCGSLFSEHRSRSPKAVFFSEKQRLELFLKKNPVKGAFIMLKGSRGIGLETLTEVL